MKSSNKQIKFFQKFSNFFLFCLAVGVAYFMWEMVSQREMIEAEISVILDYSNIPPNLTITDGLQSRISVRLSGPETLVRSIPKDGIHKGMDLSRLKKGDNTVPLTTEQVLDPMYRAFKVIDINPSKLELKVDRIVEKNVPIKAVIISPLKNDLQYDRLSIIPSTVVLSGPESRIEGYKEIPLEIHLKAEKQGKGTEYLVLDTPNLVTADPPRVKVEYEVLNTRTEISRRCRVVISGVETQNYKLNQDYLDLNLEVPEKLSGDENYLNQCIGYVAPPYLADGESRTMTVRLNFPEGMTLSKNAPKTYEVIVYKLPEKKNNPENGSDSSDDGNKQASIPENS